MKHLHALATATLLAAGLAFAATPAQAQFLGIGKKKQTEDFSATLPAPAAKAG